MPSTNIASIIASGLFLGYSPKAPGTIGSLGALFAWYFLTTSFGTTTLSLIFLGTTIAGFLATASIVKNSPEKDPQFIVIDEVVGMWIAAFTLTPNSGWLAWASAFALFRFFDITKPWLVGKAEQLPGEMGVMADDIVAGFFALLLMICIQLVMAGQ